MTPAPIGERIDEAYSELTPQEQRAADFILDHLSDLAVYNASELASLSGVSKATVSRLFRRLGFTDAHEVRNHARALRNEGVPVGAHTSSATLDPHVDREIANIRMLAATLSDGRLHTAAALLAHARTVVIVGLRNSYPLALHLRQQLVQGLADVRLAPLPGQSIGEELVALDDRDVVILVGFRRRPDGFASIVDAITALSIPLILIADSSAQRYAPAAVVSLDCPLDSVSTLDSYAAANSLVALLAAETLATASRTSRTRISSINRLYTTLNELERPAPHP